MRFIHQILLIWVILCACLVTPGRVLAQGTQTEAFGMIVDDAQVEAWLGRESEIDHPVMDNLVSRDAATLHFYFSKEYAQRANAVIATAEKAREKTLRFLPAETVENVHIYLLGNINQYFEAQNSKGRAPEWSAGLTILRDGVILIRLAPRGGARVEAEMTLAHELNHVALRRFAQDNYFPHWFYEGLAMTATDDWNLQRAETMAKASMSGKLLDLEGIDRAFSKTGAIVDLAYAQSAHFVSWLTKEYGDDAMRRLIRETSSGIPFESAFSKVYDRSLKASFASWHDSISREESIWASIFSHDGLFFFISIFAAFGLCIALWRKRSIRKQRLASMNNEIPITALPENLRNFGPFTHQK